MASAAADLLLGSVGNDRLLGGIGRDTLKGNAGSDTLSGGGGVGADVFYTRDGLSDQIDGGGSHDRPQGDQGLEVLLSMEESLL